MGQWRSDIIHINIDEHDIKKAEEIATETVDNYFDRFNYSRDIRISKIKLGYIGERIFEKYMRDNLSMYDDDKKINFQCTNNYANLEPDCGWDFSIGNNKKETFDIKCYSMKNKEIKDAIIYIYNQFHLLIDKKQYNGISKAKHYVPTFYMENTCHGFIAGIHTGMPSVELKFKRDSYGMRICDINPISSIFSKIIPKLIREET